ncbi:MAG: aspartyl protease family protein [Anaerolineales bacterium]|nr:aspartyl protease family protein [Anaerolineales bacterium]
MPEQPLALGPFDAVVDTGADICLVPITLLSGLDVPPIGYRYLRSAWGQRQSVSVFALDIGIGTIRLPSMEVAAYPVGEEVILGLNARNRLVVILNGPKQMLELET